MSVSGYSGTPLGKKLGIKEGFCISFINVPENYFELIGSLPEKLIVAGNSKIRKDLIHYFSKDIEQVKLNFPRLKRQLKSNGMIWISWPKKNKSYTYNISEDAIRSIGIINGLVDIKVCAIDDTWSALKFVIPIKDRTK